jgi:betaine-aldehyde dehydrogenase
LIAFADADPCAVADAMITGMNFAWCGQSCGSTSRAFVHAAIYDAVLKHLHRGCSAIRPGLPTEPETKMGAICGRVQFERILAMIETGRSEGTRLLLGGGQSTDPLLAKGFFIDPTVFVDVTPEMRIAREEIFGPVLSVLRWDDEAAMVRAVNALDYGLTCSIWTNDLDTAHRTATGVEAGYVWVNDVGRHFPGAPFGGYKQSGIGREEYLEETDQLHTGEEYLHPAATSEQCWQVGAIAALTRQNIWNIDLARTLRAKLSAIQVVLSKVWTRI